MKRPPASLAGAMVLVIVATAFAGVVGLVAPAQARFADPNTGSGLYPGSITWIEWGASGENLFSGTTRTDSRVVAGATIDTECSISNVGGQGIQAYISGDWRGDSLDDLYNIGGTGTELGNNTNNNQLVAGIKNAVSGDTVNFSVDCEVRVNGTPVPINGLVFADAESSETLGSGSTQFEYTRVTPRPGTSAWRIIDRYQPAGCPSFLIGDLDTSTDTLEIRNSGEACEKLQDSSGDLYPRGSTAVAFIEGATGVDVTMRGRGVSAVALGVVANVDVGDAPTSYGEAAALLQPSWSGGVVQPGVNFITDPNFPLGAPDPLTPRLGDTIDSDADYVGSVDALADDSTGNASSDEDSFTPDTTITTDIGENYDPTIQCVGPGAVTAWIDWNHNGVFDTGTEQSATEICGGPGSTVTPDFVPVPADTVDSFDSGTPTYMRVRIATDNADSQLAQGMARNGEVEDYRVFVDLPERVLQIDKTVTGFSGPWSFDFTLTPDGGSPVTDTVTDAAPSISFDLERDTTYTLEELVPAGWDSDLTCSVPDEDGTTPGVQFTTPDNASPLLIECDATNDTSASVSVTKSVTNADPGQSWSFDFDLTPAGGSAATESVDDASPTATWDDLVAGTEYTLTEVSQSDWLLENMECSIGGAPIGDTDFSDGLTFTPGPGESVVCTATNTDVSADIELDKRLGTLPGGGIVGDANGNGLADVGEILEYEFEVTNTGKSELTSVGVTDPKIGTVTCSVTTLAPGASTICVATYTVTQADVDAGSVDNTATASGIPPATAADPDPAPVTDDDSNSFPANALAEIEIVKSAVLNDGDGDSLADVGETITYEFDVTNTGTVTLDPVSVNDPKVGTVTCPTDVLAPGDSMTCTATDYTVTQADIDAGSVDNTATATGTPPTGPDVTDTDSETVDVDQTPEIFIEKSATLNDGDGDSLADLGETITYEFEVTNTGTVTLDPVSVSDPKVGTVTCPTDVLAPGASMICTASDYTVTQADVDAGSVDNTATATGTPPTGPDATDDDSTSTPTDDLAAIEIVKSATLNDGDGDSLADVGETITYEFEVTNTGTVTLDPVSVSDPKAGTVTCATDVLLPGASTTCTAADYTVTQADVDAGSVDNTATATGTPPTGPDVTDTDSETVDVDQTPEISIVKSASLNDGDGDSLADVGETITYEFDVTNTGTVTLDPVAVDDPKVGAVTCSPNVLAPGDSVTCTATDYTVTQADVDAGSVDNTATATGTPPTGPDVTDTDSETVDVDQTPEISIVKSASLNDGDGDSLADVGETITYEFEVTNTGTVTLDPVSVSDPKVGTVTCPTDVLAPGASMTCTATDYTVTQADVDAGSVDNTATATGTPPTGPDVTDDDSTSTPADDVAAVEIVKSATLNDGDGDSLADVGETITYEFEVTNTGTVTLDPVSVSDPKVGTVTCPTDVLAPGASMICTASDYTVTQADVDAGSVDNTATATGTPPTGPDVTDTGSETVDVDQTPEISIVKSATLNDGDGDSLADVGETISYEFEVTNTGTVTLDPVSVDDPKVGTVTCSPNVLAPGDSVTCTATDYTVTQADVDAGSVDNTATATGTPPTGPDVTDTDSETVDVDQTPEIEIVKSATLNDGDGDSLADVGETITYQFEVTNSGTVTLDPVSVSDPKVGTVTCSPDFLAPGDSVTCTATDYTVSLADVNAGSVDNTATATGTPPTGPDVTDDDSTSTPTDVTPAIEIVKSAVLNDGDGDSLADVGETITYEFEVTNTGTVTLDPVSVSDPKVGAVTCSPSVLDPGDSVTCTAADYTVTQADVDSGSVDNTATATGTPPTGPDVTDTDSETVDVDQTPAIEIVKSATLNDGDGDSLADVGETITYEFEVTNTGTVTLDPVSVDDPKVGTVTCSPDFLAPGDSVTCTATDYTVTQADVDAGSVDNTATATGTPPTGGDVTDTGSETVDVDQTPAIEIVKSATLNDGDGDSLADVGETITYEFEVTNTGTVTLDPVAVNDPKVGTVTCSPDFLAPGDSVTCTAADYTVTQADVDSGSVDNTATATGTPPTGPDVTDTDSETVDVDQTPALEIVKAATLNDGDGDSLADVGETITYEFEVTNTGTVTLDPVSVDDPKVGTVACSPDFLAPGDSVTCTAADYTVTQADVDSGSVDNTATATGTPPTGPDVTDTDSETVDVDQTPALEIVKSATLNDGDGDSLADVGETISYEFEVTNTGTVTLDPVSVDDPKVGTVTCSPDFLAPGDSVTCTAADYTVTQADVDSGSVDNTATATGTPPTGPDVTDTDSETVDVDQTPAIEIVKSATLNDGDGDSLADVGETITYEFEVTNTGTVTLDPVSVDDPKVGAVTCSPDFLAPGDSVTCTAADYTVTQADVDSGSVDNTATATGTPPTGPDVTDTGSETVNVDDVASIAIVKTATPSASPVDVGDTISFTFEVTNDGNVTLDPVTISDPVAGPVTCTDTALAPGASTTCSADAPYVVSLADVNAGSVDNTATVTGTPPTGPDVTDDDSTSTPADVIPGIEIVKTATLNDGDGDSLADAGETITYEFEVTNTGTVTLDPVSVDDPKVGAVTCSPNVLDPGDSVTCTAADYTVTQADVDSGSVDNTATATGTPPTGPDVTDTGSETVDVDQTPAIDLVKDGVLDDTDGNGTADVGEVIDYTLVATNTGTVTLTDVDVEDPLLENSGLTWSCTPDVSATPTGVTLLPGESINCVGSYEVVQPDVDRGFVLNIATATGTPPTGPDVIDRDTVPTPSDVVPDIELVKVATLNDGDGDGLADVGETITYTFDVTNTGTVTLDPVSVSDAMVDPVTCSPTVLAPNESVTCTAADYTVTQADVDAGSIVNSATATGTPPRGPDVTDDDTTTTPADQTPVIEVVKTATLNDGDGDGLADVGETITYEFEVTNTGTVTLDPVSVDDPKVGAVTCSPDFLAPGDSVTCTAADYTVTQADVDSGSVDNTATATGTPPTGPDVTDTGSETVDVDQTPAIEIVKSATLNDGDGDSLADVGETISYEFEVTNTGTVTLDPVSVDDPKVGTVTCSPDFLAPGEFVTCTAADYTVTQADVDAGSVDNTATATGTPPTGADVTDDDSATTPADAVSGVELSKSAQLNDLDGDGLADVGETITYWFEVTNTGTVTLDPVAVEDPMLGAVTCDPDALAPGESVICTADDYTVTQADVDAGEVANSATATGTPPTGEKVTDGDTTTTPTDSFAGVALEKYASLDDANGNGYGDEGEEVTYTFNVTNTGSVTITDFTIDDPLVGAVECDTYELAPGASASCEAVHPYVITAADAVAGSVVNVATVTAHTGTDNPTTVSAEANATVRTGVGPELPVTGFDVRRPLFIATLLTLFGFAFVVVARRREW